MCGIAGIFHRDGAPASPVLLKRMTDSIAHRGPDGEGYYTDRNLALGHRRLAIIDLSAAAHQPMQTRDGRFTISYNGEIYNYQELRLELEALGHQFHSRSDTEVLLYLLAANGASGLQRLNGMFALGLWDRDRRELLLARDRFGVKPLYYTQIGSTLLFASEVKALLQYPGCRSQMDPAALLEYMTFQNLFTDRTLFKDIHLLPAGSFIRVRQSDNSLRTERYWDFSFVDPKLRDRPGEYLERLDYLFRQAVTRQLISDVPVGSYLSGGMDSGSITAIAAPQIQNMKTFTVGFDLTSASGMEIGLDERPKAEHMSYLFKTEHYEMVLKAGDMERVMPKLVWHLEEPRVGQCYPNFYAAQLASKFCKVVLSGAGGDELFGGYPWRYYRAVVNNDFDHYVDKYYAFWQRLIPNEEIRNVFGPIWHEVDDVRPRDIFRNVFDHHANELRRPEDYINHSLYFEVKTFLHGLLVVEDKLSMANSLETRVPFLDNDLVEFASCIPVSLKLGNLGDIIKLNENEPGSKTEQYFQRTRDGKLILRQAMGRYVPAEVTQREKQGFTAPDATWYRGESIDYVRATLLANNARIYDFLDRHAVAALLSEHLKGRQNRRLLIWSLLYLEHWCKTFLRAMPAVS